MDLSKIQPLVIDVLAKKDAFLEAKADSAAAKAREDSLGKADEARHEHLEQAKDAFSDAIDALSDAFNKELVKLDKLLDAP